MVFKSFFLSIILFAIAAHTSGQKVRPSFRSINNVGLLTGSSDQQLQVQSINGVAFKNLFAGIGAGLDNYYIKTVPLFVDVRKPLAAGKQVPFVYADLGAAFPLDRNMSGVWSKSHYKTGWLYDAGLGYVIPINRKLAFNFTAGYSQKFLTEVRQEFFWTWSDVAPVAPADSYQNTSYNRYNLKRFVFKAGLSF